MFNSKLKQELAAVKQQLLEKQSMLTAISSSQGIIEFDLNGNVLELNDNFAKMMGYSKQEAIGQNHRNFVLPDYAKSAAYKQFWETLRSGKFVSDRFKRVAKDGSFVWLEAAYTPVLDNQESPYKVVKLATDVTDQINQELDSKGQLDAINRAMAVISFDLNGNILHANDNFLSAVGYSLSEVQGKHHRIFVTSEYSQSAEYQKFWSDLSQGHFLTGTYQRKTKQGADLWLEASYNPIFDDEGNPIKVVKYATDVGKNENSMLLQNVISDAGAVLEKVSEGDLTPKMKQHLSANQVSMFRPQIESLTQSIDHMNAKLTDIVVVALESSNVVQGTASEVAQGALDLSQRVQEQAASVEETSATMEQMSSQVQSNTDNAKEAEDISKNARTQADSGVDAMQKTMHAMENIQESSHKISEIVSLIDSIAFQTNLLALNAAVEAARAGDHGRGFAVVAGEVRSLAQKSADAAKDIKKLVDETSDRVTQGVEMANQSEKILEEINHSINTVTKMITHIAEASSEQAAGIGQVNTAVTQIDQVTQQNAALVEETSAAAESMSSQAEILHKQMSFFNTGSNSNKQSNSTPKITRETAPALNKPAKPQKPAQAQEQNTNDEWEDF